MIRNHHESVLSSQAIKALSAIILTSLIGIILLSAWGIALRAGLAGGGLDDSPLNAGSADEALSILGNIAAAAVGGLVGWLTRDMVRVDRRSATPDANSEQTQEDTEA
jgi:hypothetical protein